jgi:hypothetical protein
LQPDSARARIEEINRFQTQSGDSGAGATKKHASVPAPGGMHEGSNRVKFDNTLRTWTRGTIVAVGLGVALAFGGVGTARAHAEHGHPARIHNGSCEELGGVAFRLNGVGGSVDLDNAPIATPIPVNEDSAYQVMLGETTIEGSLDDLFAADHAVMIYESDDDMSAIACGNLGGALLGDSLVTGLAESGHPGHLGFAIFEPAGDQTHITVIIGHALAPVTANGADADHEHAEGEDGLEEGEAAEDGHEQEQKEDGHEAVATPDA